MAMTLGEIVTRYTVDTSGFSSGMSQMERAAKSFDTMSKMHAANFQAAMGHLPGAMTPVQSALDKTSRSVQSFGNQVQTTASTSSGHFSRIAQSTSSGFGGMAKSVLAAGAGLGGWIFAAKSAVEGAVGLGQALLGSSADMEQTRIAFTGLMGGAKQADAMLNQLQAFAAKTPFEFPELAKDTQMLIGMGVASKDVIPWMTAIGDAAAGIGAGAEGANSITRALGQMQAKGKISGEEMMQLTEAGIPAWKILAQSMGLTVAQVQDLSQKGQLGQGAINGLVTGMEKMYGGQMKNQATTFNGLLSTLKDNAGMALRAFVGPLFEAAKSGLSTLVNFLGSPAFQNFATGAAKWIADAMQRIGQFIGPVVAGIGQLIGSFTSGKGDMGGFASTIGGIANTILPLLQTGFQQMVGFVTGSVIPAIRGLAPTFAAIGTIVQTALPVIGRIIVVFLEISNTLRGVAIAAFSAILPVIVNLANFVMSLLVPAIKFIAPYILQAVNAIGQFVSEIAARAMPLIQQFAANMMNWINAIKTVWMAVWPILGPIVGGVFQEIVGVIKIAWAIISGIFKIALDLLSGNWARAWTDLKDMLGGVWDGIVTYLKGAFQIITSIFGTIAGAVGAAFSGLGTQVNEIWTGIVSAITGFMTAIWNGIVTPFVDLWSAISGPLQAIWNGIVAVFSPMIGFISDVMRIIGGILSLGWSIVWGQISGFLTNIWNTITSVWNTIWSFLSGIMSRIWNTIVSAWNTISGFIGSIISTIWNTEVRGWTNIWNSITSFLGRIWDTISSVWNTIKNYIGSVLGTILSIISGIWNTIWGTITGFVGRIWDTITGTFNRIRDTVGGIFRGMINNIIGWLNPGLDAISNFLNFFINGINKVSQFFIKKDLLGTVHLGPIGYLAHGTQDWRGGLAVVGEEGPELVSLPKHAAVLPHNESEDWLAGRTKFPSFAGGIGDFMGNIFSWISGGVGDIAGNVMKNIFSNAPSLGIFGDIAGNLLSTVSGWLGQWIKDNIASLFGSFTGTLPAMQQGQFLLPPNLGFPGYAGHHGMDFQFPQGSPVTEIVGGTVSPHTGWYSFGGEIDVLVDRIAGLWERYLHMSQIFVQGGQRVDRGDLIGLSGGGTYASGYGRGSNGPHLHLQYDWGDYSNFVPPLSVWSALGMFDPFMLSGKGAGAGSHNRAFKKGGVISEQIQGIGISSGKPYSFGERGMESVVPASAQERMAQALERIERLLSNDGRLTEYQVQQSLGRLLASGVR